MKTFLLFLLFLSWAFAASMTLSSVTLLTSNPHEVDTYSITVQASYSAPSGSTNCKAKVSQLPSGWEVRDGYDTNYKMLSSCSGSTTFDIMPTSIVQSPTVVVEVGGTDSTGQPLIPGTGSPSQTIIVKNQPVLDLTINVTNTTVTKGSTRTLSYQLKNIGTNDTAATESATLTISASPSGAVTFSGGTTIAAGSGTVNPGETATGTTTLQISSSYLSSNSISLSIEASSSNSMYKSTKTSSLTCTNCVYVAPAPAEEEGCTESWNCTTWTACSPSGVQTRTCTDLNGCGTTTDKPATTQNCTLAECTTNVQCPNDKKCVGSVCVAVTGTCGYATNHTWIRYECCADTDCPTGKECKENKCVAKVVPPECTTDVDCPGGKECIAQKCVEKPILVISTRNITTIPGGGIVTIQKVTAGERTSVGITAEVTRITDIVDIEIYTNKNLSDVKVTVKKLIAPPPEVPLPQKDAYGYLEITAENITAADINKSTIKFKVEKSWIGTKYNSSTVSLSRYVSGWTDLPTKETDKDENYHYFEATSPGFSYFAITAEEVAAPPSPPAEGISPIIYLVIIIVILIIIVGVVSFLLQKKKKWKT